MDVDPGKDPFFLFDLSIRKPFLLLDVPVLKERAKVVSLPYSLVPGLSLDSPLFNKAISTISKQTSKAASAGSASRRTVSERLTAPVPGS